MGEVEIEMERSEEEDNDGDWPCKFEMLVDMASEEYVNGALIGVTEAMGMLWKNCHHLAMEYGVKHLHCLEGPCTLTLHTTHNAHAR